MSFPFLFTPVHAVTLYLCLMSALKGFLKLKQYVVPVKLTTLGDNIPFLDCNPLTKFYYRYNVLA